MARTMRDRRARPPPRAGRLLPPRRSLPRVARRVCGWRCAVATSGRLPRNARAPSESRAGSDLEVRAVHPQARSTPRISQEGFALQEVKKQRKLLRSRSFRNGLKAGGARFLLPRLRAWLLGWMASNTLFGARGAPQNQAFSRVCGLQNANFPRVARHSTRHSRRAPTSL